VFSWIFVLVLSNYDNYRMAATRKYHFYIKASLMKIKNEKASLQRRAFGQKQGFACGCRSIPGVGSVTPRR
jgi:hypothetical protein